MAKAIKETLIKKRVKELLVVYANLPDDKMKIARPLIENAAFMEVSLKELQEKLNAQGLSDEYKNGANQYGTKASADLQAYNSVIKSYNMVNSRLEAMLKDIPVENKKSKLDAFIEANS